MSANTSPPFISIVVPTYNRPVQLGVCLAALAKLEYPQSAFEVIVVDDGSAESPEPVVVPWRGRLKNLTLLHQLHAGPAAARNTGAAKARGEFLAFTDDDCAPAADWLAVLAARLQVDPEAMFGGRTVNSLADNACAASSQLLISYLYACYNADAERARFFTSNNMMLAARRFREVGGFDAVLQRPAGEDRELCDRWRKRGWPMRYVPAAVVRHGHAMTLCQLWRQHYDYGRAACYVRVNRARRDGNPVRVELWRFYADLLRYPFTIATDAPLRQAGLLLITQLANALGFLRERLRPQYRPA